ncbi:DNA-binding protein [Lapidilactobacillus dextrinicus]|uniref:DNA-binding protein n=1 Tax=Lapidilactobacillus dextrinicus TaxID=51664 RepID=UPI0022E90D6A|nr:DNA-binding protein [Lapidilactobacillus dextrinicus]
MKIEYIPVDNCLAEWGNKQAILRRYEGLNIYTLNRWLSEMRGHRKWSKGVINPTHKLVFINFEIFQDFLRWKQHGYLKIRAN